MDLRTKLVFALVGVSLGSMLALGLFGYQEGRGMLQTASLDKLAAVAESRRQDLRNVMRGWSDRVSLIASRTQLRLSLAEYNRTGRTAERERMNRILDDARAAVASVDYLAVFDTSGQRVAVSWGNPSEQTTDTPELSEPDVVLATGRSEPTYLGVETTGDGRRQVEYLTPLSVEREPIGWLLVRLGAEALFEITQDYTGLGETGETMIVLREAEGLRVLHRVRHPGLVGGSWIPERGAALDPATFAAAGIDTALAEGVTDYRGVDVWAATRHLDGPGWGVVVKADVEEERQPIVGLRDRTVRLALSLAAFAILGGILLGLHLSRPVQELAEVANRIRSGETKARAVVRAQDEVGVLARTFNSMADALLESDVSLSDRDLKGGVERLREQVAAEGQLEGERPQADRGDGHG
ncbi:MAG: HAMP domain-containing protein [Gemmatimonadota bacterium]|nr:HAMP domain-containing protein [Gemmatimonadota bacterium]